LREDRARLRVDDDHDIGSGAYEHVDFVLEVAAVVAGRTYLDREVRRNQRGLELVFRRVTDPVVREIGYVRNERPDLLAGRRYAEAPFAAHDPPPGRPIFQLAPEPKLQHGMRALRAHLPDRPAAQPLRLRFRLRQDDLA
jgi:hypothetical protein